MNYWAVLAAAASSFLLGGLWYSKPVFGGLWARESGVKEQSGHAGRVFAVSFLFSLLAAACFAYVLGPAPSLPAALKLAVIAGVGFVAASFGINYQFAQRSQLLWAIDGGYHAVQFLLFGVILGLWH